MKAPTLKFRRHPEPDAADTQEPTESDLGSVLEWTGGAAMATKVIRWVLIGCLITGPFALLLAIAGLGSSTVETTAPVAQVDQAEVDERAAVTAFAQDFVVTWLTATDGHEDALAPFVDDSATLSLPKKPWTAANPTTAGIEKTSDLAWTVTVAATVGSPGQPSIRRFFTVPISFDPTGAMVALSTPTPVAGPERATTPRLDYRYRATSAAPVSIAAEEFLGALIAGGGDVTRFITPGADIKAITPAPYTSVELEDVLVDDELTEADANPETGRTVHLLITATAALTRDQATTVAYALTMTAREGRWEVAALDPAPKLRPVSDPSAQPETTGGAAPSSPTTDALASASPTE